MRAWGEAVACEALFNNHCFLLAFLPVVLAGYWLLPWRRARLGWLALASLVFYSFWDVRFVWLLLLASAVDFIIALRMRQSDAPKRWLIGSIAFNLGMLAFFKYAMFAGDNVRSLFDVLGVPIQVPYYEIVLPVGISFYTFQTMSYTIDVYRREIEPTGDPVKYLAFVTAFPQLVAGPIVRYREIERELDHLPRRLPRDAVVFGVTLLVIGLFKKIAIADTIAMNTSHLWGDTSSLDAPHAWVAAIGYSLQLYFDFSGYSDMAIGMGALLGFTFPKNFDAPYQALDPRDFWRRWHISLSTFLRDYLYVPLGGNRGGLARTRVNLLIVMLLGGLWHGAAWTFVIWGAYHGSLLVAYHVTARWWDASPRLVRQAGMLFLVVLGWVVFRAENVAVAADVYTSMFSLAPLSAWIDTAPSLVALAAILLFTAVATPSWRLRPAGRYREAALLATAFAFAVFLIGGRTSPFLYYQF